MPIYGIDLGTTYSAIAMLGANNLPEVIENFADGSSKIASVVYFPKDGYPIVGGQAKDRAEHEPERVAEYVMSYIERSDSIICSFDGVDYDAVKILSLILKRIKLYAAEQDHEVKDVIVTCPVNFGLEGKIAIKQASELAGLNVLR
ncbi:MAG: Hsp70 family protein, partial [Clostridiales bacterium]|nr:Hsp70 family protein [Clostridiales bacterium]